MAFGIVPRIQSFVMRKYAWSEKQKSFLLHPAGPFTIHFWCPFMKWAITFANIGDLWLVAPENISTGQQSAVTATGFIWARYSTQIIPKNWSLCAVNFCMGLTGLVQLSRKFLYSQKTE